MLMGGVRRWRRGGQLHTHKIIKKQNKAIRIQRKRNRTMSTAANVAKKMASKAMLSLVVNGKTVKVPSGSTLLTAIRAAGARVPTLCYHPEFKAHATCRMCLVDVEGRNKPVAACHYPCEDNLKVTTDSPSIREFRRNDLQFILSRHPNECMRCEASGDCKLQSLVQEEQVEDTWPKSLRGSLEHPEHLVSRTSRMIRSSRAC